VQHSNLYDMRHCTVMTLLLLPLNLILLLLLLL
jgi:hypothetical protein